MGRRKIEDWKIILIVLIIIGGILFFKYAYKPLVTVPPKEYIPLEPIVTCITNQDCQDFIISEGKAGITRCNKGICESLIEKELIRRKI